MNYKTAHKRVKSYYRHLTDKSPVNWHTFDRGQAHRIAVGEWVKNSGQYNALWRQQRYLRNRNDNDRDFLSRSYQLYLGHQKYKAEQRLRSWRNFERAKKRLADWRFLSSMKKDSRGYYYN